MRNPLTIKVEFHVVTAFILGLSLFYIIIVYKAMKDFESELARMEAERIEFVFDR